MTKHEIHRALLKGSIELLDTKQITLRQFSEKVNEVIIDRDKQDYEYVRAILTELEIDAERVNYLTDLFRHTHGLQDKSMKEIFSDVLQESSMMLISGEIDSNAFKMLIKEGFIKNNIDYEFVAEILAELKITDIRLSQLIKEAYSK